MNAVFPQWGGGLIGECSFAHNGAEGSSVNALLLTMERMAHRRMQFYPKWSECLIGAGGLVNNGADALAMGVFYDWPRFR